MLLTKRGRFCSRMLGLCWAPETSSSLRAIFQLQTSHAYFWGVSHIRLSPSWLSNVGMTGRPEALAGRLEEQARSAAG